MASGCNNNNTVTKTCPSVISGKCVKYQGVPFPQFNVCTGDLLDEDLEIIFNLLAANAEGEGIEISDITPGCAYVTNLLANKDNKLVTKLQALFDATCNLDSRITALETAVEPPYPFDLGCLPTPTVVSRDTILQETITKTCENSASITNILNQLADDTSEESILNAVVELIGNKLLSQLNSCQGGVTKTGTGSTAAVSFDAQIPIRGMVFGDFNISSFDNTGLGLASAGFCRYAIANGQNGTVDMRGFTAAGSNSPTIPGGALNSMVQPGLDTDLQNNIGARKGAYKVVLSSSQIPNHSHTVTQQPHNHTVQGVVDQDSPDYGNGGAGMNHFKGTVTTSSTTIDIQVGGVTGGSGVGHENRPPTYYGIWIQRIS